MIRTKTRFNNLWSRIATLSFLILLSSLKPCIAFAQYPGNAPMGSGPSEDDIRETEDIADGEYSLPPDELLKEDDDDTNEAINEIERQNAKELAYSSNEKRTRFTYVAGLMIGIGRPWQIYSVDIGFLRNERQAFGMYAGGGGISTSGITNEKAYDMRIVSRGSGFFFRQWLDHPDVLSIDFGLGYTAWEGRVSPHGSDPDENESDVLTSSFRGSGVSAGIAATLTWVWNSGFHLEWIPVLVHCSRFIEKDISRESEIVKETIKRNIETPALNGLTSLRLGFYF